MKFPETPLQGTKFLAESGVQFVWNGYAWDLDSSISQGSASSMSPVSSSVEEVKEDFVSSKIVYLSDIPFDFHIFFFCDSRLFIDRT